MESKVTQKFKRENDYSNINHVFTISKGTLMLITKVFKYNGTTNCFHH